MCDSCLVASWHPLLSTREDQPGIWDLLTPDGEPYGRVEIRRAGDRVFYRCWFRDKELKPKVTLRAATMAVHQAYIATLSPGRQPGRTHPQAVHVSEADTIRHIPDD